MDRNKNKQMNKDNEARSKRASPDWEERISKTREIISHFFDDDTSGKSAKTTEDDYCHNRHDKHS